VLISPTKNVSYKVNFPRLVFDLLPIKLRKRKFFNLLCALVAPLRELNDSFLNYIDQIEYEMSITGETAVLERHLRNYYTNEGINIVNTSYIFQQFYLYSRSEIGDTSNSNNYLYRKSETLANPEEQVYISSKSSADVAYDFKVEIPNELIAGGVTIPEVEAIVNKYRSLGTIFKVEVV
jgi:hypothetical protein